MTNNYFKLALWRENVEDKAGAVSEPVGPRPRQFPRSPVRDAGPGMRDDSRRCLSWVFPFDDRDPVSIDVAVARLKAEVGRLTMIYLEVPTASVYRDVAGYKLPRIGAFPVAV